MKKVWKTLLIAGYVLLGLFGINLLYTLFVYAVRLPMWQEGVRRALVTVGL